MTSSLLLVDPRPVTVTDVDIVIPVYNEEADLEAAVRRLHGYLRDRFPLAWTITIADNASVDTTWGIACRLTNELDAVRAVHLGDKGRGRALRAAWSQSTARVVAYMDVDLSTDLDALLPLVAPLLSGHSDVAIGSRLAPGARVVREPKREVISRCYNLLLKTTLRNAFSDAQCGFKAVRADIAARLLPLVEDDGWFFDTELLVLAEHNGLRIHEVPVDWVDNPRSSVHLVGTARDDVKGIARMLRRFASGDGRLPLNAPARAGQVGLAGLMARFAAVGASSTALFVLLFLALFGPLGAVAADVGAFAVCAALNTTVNRRVTFGSVGRPGRRHDFQAGIALATVPVVVSVVAIVVLGAAGVTSAGADLAAVTVLNAVCAAGRFLAMRRWFQ